MEVFASVAILAQGNGFSRAPASLGGRAILCLGPVLRGAVWLRVGGGCGDSPFPPLLYSPLSLALMDDTRWPSCCTSWRRWRRRTTRRPLCSCFQMSRKITAATCHNRVGQNAMVQILLETKTFQIVPKKSSKKSEKLYRAIAVAATASCDENSSAKCIKTQWFRRKFVAVRTKTQQ